MRTSARLKPTASSRMVLLAVTSSCLALAVMSARMVESDSPAHVPALAHELQTDQESSEPHQASGAATAPGDVGESRPGQPNPGMAPVPLAVHPMVPSDVLRSAILDVLAGQPARVGVVAWRLDDGLLAAIDEDVTFYAASLFKLAVLYAAERRLSDGTMDPAQSVLFDDAAVAEDLGTFDRLGIAPGESLTVAQVLDAMITFSDNASAVALHHLLGGGTIDSDIAQLGLTGTSVNTTELPTTAADMARLMTALVTGAGLAPAETARVLDLLERQENRNGIPAGVPGGTVVGNKTGTWDEATHDVAFVDAPGGRYVLAILSDGDYDWDLLARVSAAVYRVMSETPPTPG